MGLALQMPPRIGTETDDYCPRCRRLTNHTVSALVGEEVASTTCRTCSFPHPYRGGKLPSRSAKPKLSAFDQVLAGIIGEQELRPAPAARKHKK